MICENCMRTLLDNITKRNVNRTGKGYHSIFDMCTNMRKRNGALHSLCSEQTELVWKAVLEWVGEKEEI